MRHTSSQFTDVINTYVERSKYTAGQLGKLTGLPKETIANWLDGVVRKPRNWRDVVRLAGALHLDEADASALLQAAGRPSIAELLAQAEDEADRALLQPWNSAAHQLQAALRQLARMPRDDVPEPTALPPGSRMPLRRNSRFVGRADLLVELAQQLRGGGTVVIDQAGIAAATGLGGVGKTQLAAEFVHRYGQFFAGGVFWLSFADPSDVPNEVAECGGAGFMDLRLDFDDMTVEQQVQVVRAAWHSPLPRLLVFDNCEEETLLDQWRPTSGGCRVLLTSRRTQWDSALDVQPLPLDVLPRADSVQLLRSHRPDIDAADMALNAIAAELDGLPLALHLAGAFLERYQYAPAAYLAALRSARLVQHESLQRGGISPTRHEQHIGRTFALSFARLDQANTTDQHAIALLARAAVFAHGETIPRDLLLDTLDDEEAQPSATERADALARLLELGLLETNAEESYRMHRLLAASVKHELVHTATQHAVEHTAARVAGALNERGDVVALNIMLRHIRHLADQALPRGDTSAAELCVTLGYTLWLLARYPQAQTYLEQALSIYQQQPEPRPLDIAGCYNMLGLINQLQARVREAQQLFERALAIWERELGPEHETTATEHNNLGYLLLLQDNYAEAQRHLRQGLQVRRRRYGLCHSETARSIHNMGFLRQRQGHYRAARRYFQLALRIRDQVLGVMHVSTSMTLSLLGEVALLLADYPRAEQFHQRALVIRQELFGEEHHDVAESLYNLGRVRRVTGDFAQARRLFEQALAINQTMLGEQHGEILSLLCEMGRLLCDEDLYEEAAQYFEDAAARWQTKLPSRHAELATLLDDFGALRFRQSRHADAETLLQQALDIRTRLLDPAHPDLARSQYHLGLLHAAQGAHATAQQCFAQALPISQRRLGAAHPLTQAIQAEAQSAERGA